MLRQLACLPYLRARRPQLCGRAPASTFLLVIALGHSSVGHCAEGPPTIDDIVNGITQFERAVFESDSVFIHYERYESIDELKTVASGGYLDAEWLLAKRGDTWLLRRRFTKPSEKEVEGELFIPKEPTVHVLKDGLVLEWLGNRQQAFVDQFKDGRNIFRGLFYTDHLSLDVGRRIAESAGVVDQMDSLREYYADELMRPFLPAWLNEHRNKYSVATQPIEFNGRTCWVVEWPEMDRFLVDVEWGYAIPRRTYHWGPGKPRKYEFINEDYREVKSGVWLPFHQTELRYASIVAENRSIWDKVASRSEYRVHKIEFDNIDESVLDVALPAGTHVWDFARNFEYVVSGDDDDEPFSKAVDNVKAHLSQSPSSFGGITLFVNIIAILVIAVFIGLKYLRQ
jgi:hypothetical protein